MAILATLAPHTQIQKGDYIIMIKKLVQWKSQCIIKIQIQLGNIALCFYHIYTNNNLMVTIKVKYGLIHDHLNGTSLNIIDWIDIHCS